jgi:hypothetical protein
MYGDEFVNAVTYGGALYVLIGLQTNNQDEFQQFSAAAQASAGSVWVSADVTQKLRSITSDERFSFKTFAVGTDNAPPAQLPTDSKSISDFLDKIFQYMNDFRDNLHSGLGSELSYENASYDIVEGAGAGRPLKLDKLQGTIQACLEIRDEIMRRQEAWSYATANPEIYQNNFPTDSDAAQNQLSAFLHTIEQFVTNIFKNPSNFLDAKPPVTMQMLPDAPKPKKTIDIPVQITIRGVNWQDRSNSPYLPILTVSAAQGKCSSFKRSRPLKVLYSRRSVR